ncbi:AMP-binding protein [Nocardioides humilatus]|uniref:AMP-binding protein n=2 Tax=Nocardioides humilatus TaxID=2607660 RepID=A0A5B1LKR0_9ACTN|nr:AMP-binding protein [Nocardioides humilatus]
MLRPLSPAKAARAASRAVRWGASPATMVGLSAVRWPDRVAVVDDAGSITYAELEQRADVLARHLAAHHGIKPGDGVALMCRNHRGLVEGIMAAGRLGADVLFVNTELPVQQLTPTLERHRPAVVVHDEEFASRLAEAAPVVPTVQVWAGDDPTDVPDADVRLGRVGKAGSLILLTSGTTGAPKGVPRQPHPTAMLGLTASAMHRLGIRAGDTMMVCPPAFHGLGLLTLMLGLGAGNTLVLHRRFDAARVAVAIEEHRVDGLVVVPTMLQRLLDLPDLARHTGSLRGVLSGGAKLSPVIANDFMDVVGDVLFDGYGSSEIGIVTLATPADLRSAPGTLGRPTMGTRILILDETGQPLPVGKVGEIFIDSAMTFDGYTGGGTKDMRHGHVSSGDLGHLDAQGRLFIDGRADDMIVSGGENVFPQPVEDVLLAHPAIADAAVVGVPDETFGQRLRAFIVLAGDGFDEDDVREHLRTHLTRYEQPRDLVVIDELPRNATGKVLTKQLAAREVGEEAG